MCSLGTGLSIVPGDRDRNYLKEIGGDADMTHVLKLEVWTKGPLDKLLCSVKRLESLIWEEYRHPGSVLFENKSSFIHSGRPNQEHLDLKFGLDLFDLK